MNDQHTTQEPNTSIPPPQEDLEFLQQILDRKDLKDKPELMELVNLNHLQYLIENGFQVLPSKPQVIPLKEKNKWNLKKKWEYDFILTIEKLAGRLKITLKDNSELCKVRNSYSNSWTYNEMVESKSFFQSFEDIDSIIEMLKTIIEHPSRFSLNGKSGNEQIVISFQLPLTTNQEFALTLFLIEKDPKEKEEEEKKFNEEIMKKSTELEQDIFEFSIQLNELLQKNGEKCHEVFPKEMMERCKEAWKKKNPGKQLPEFAPTNFDAKQTSGETKKTTDGK